MYYIIIKSLYLFFVVLEMLLFAYIITRWIRLTPKIMDILLTLVSPILEPIRYLLQHSIFQVRGYDISPILGFIVVSYLQQFFFNLQ